MTDQTWISTLIVTWQDTVWWKGPAYPPGWLIPMVVVWLWDSSSVSPVSVWHDVGGKISSNYPLKNMWKHRVITVKTDHTVVMSKKMRKFSNNNWKTCSLSPVVNHQNVLKIIFFKCQKNLITAIVKFSI